MSAYEVRLEGREEIAAGTMAFHFAKPGDFNFIPGQAIDVTVTTPAGPAIHAFSIVSAPFESRLSIATRMRDSAFKQALKALAIGSAIPIEGPFGALTLHDDRRRPAILLAGGIGITPFISMLRQATEEGLRQRFVLLYSNRRPEDAAFLAELQQLEKRNADFRLLATMTQMQGSQYPWSGETGPLNADLLQRGASGLTSPIYYLAGPPLMVESLRDKLNGIGVADEDIRSEEFYGY